MKKLKITRIVRNSSTLPYNEQYYPGITIEEAIQLEREGEDSWEEGFFEGENLNIQTFVEVVEDDDDEEED